MLLLHLILVCVEVVTAGCHLLLEHRRQHFFNHLKASIGYGLSGSQAGIDSYTTLALVNPSGFVPAGSGSVVSFAELKTSTPT